MRDLSNRSPFAFLVTTQITDSQGRILAKVGPLDEDIDGHIVHQMSQNLSLSSIFLSEVLIRITKEYSVTTNELIQFILESPIINEQDEKFLSDGIDAYFVGKYNQSIHLLVPQIERVIRNLVELSGGAILKPSRNGGYHLKTLDELIKSQEVISALGKDASIYFRTLLTDQRGWNIRNNVCHGISSYEQMNKNTADRVLHVLLVLSLIRNKEV